MKHRDPPFDAFKPAEFPPESLTVEFHTRKGHTLEEAERAIAQRRISRVYLNSLYQVEVIPAQIHAHATGWPAMIWLSIKRRDRRPIHDWRHLQRIKNALIGAEHEAIELYPAESRMVDEANQYHLWVLADPEQRFPFGHTARLLGTPEEAAAVGARQRPFDEHEARP